MGRDIRISRTKKDEAVAYGLVMPRQGGVTSVPSVTETFMQR
jgi:hypothetical protein